MHTVMNHLVRPVQREDVPELEAVFLSIENNLGFIPNGIMTMAKNPALAQAFGGLFKCLSQFHHIGVELKWAIATISSNAAGCHYCQGHFSHIASRLQVNRNKILAAFEFETSSYYNDQERAALRFAFACSTSPAHLKAAHYQELGQFYSEQAVVEIAAVIAICGFLNRWNTAMDSELEAEPAALLAEIQQLSKFSG